MWKETISGPPILSSGGGWLKKVKKITLGSETASHSFWAFSHPHRQVIPDYQKLEVLVAVAGRSMTNIIIIQNNYVK